MAKERTIYRFGSKLNQLRVTRKLSLQQLASALGYSAHGYLSELEAGKKQPTIELVLATARYFDVTTDELLKDELELSERRDVD